MEKNTNLLFSNHQAQKLFEDSFIIGYGLGDGEKHRNFNFILEVLENEEK